MRVSRLAAAALAALLLGAAPPPDPTQLLRQAVDAYAKYSYVGQVQNVDFGTSRSSAVLFRIEHLAPNFTRRWYLAPESLYGDSIISRGDTNYNVDVHNNHVIVVQDDALDDQVALDDNFDLLLANYRALMGPEDNVAGRPALEVLLVNKYTGQAVLRISLDAKTKLVLQKEEYSASGAVTNQMRFEQLRYSQAIPGALFTVPTKGFTRTSGQGHSFPSSDLKTVLKNAGFSARVPRYLPEGFVPVAGDVTEVKRIRMLHLLYSDGIRSISLFENDKGAATDLSQYTVHDAKVNAYGAKYVEDGATTLLSWDDGTLHYALVGEVSRDELERIASSITK